MTISSTQRQQIESAVRRAIGSKVSEQMVQKRTEQELSKLSAQLEAKANAKAQAKQQARQREREHQKREERQRRNSVDQQTRTRTPAVAEPVHVILEATVTATDPSGRAGAGLHIRPSAMIARRLSRECPGVELEATGPRMPGYIPIRGTLSLTGLAAGPGDEISFRVHSSSRKEAERAVRVIREVLEGDPLSSVPHEEILRRLDPEFPQLPEGHRYFPGERRDILAEMTKRFYGAGEPEPRWDAVREVRFTASAARLGAPL